MSENIWSTQDLTEFFGNAVRGALSPMGDEGLLDYLAQMLARFTLFDNVYRLRTDAGQRLTDVADMLVEGDVRLNATSFAREREVHRHIGDFTLFWTGVFPESVPRLKGFGHDLLIDYRRQGKESYHIVSTFDLGRYRDEAPLFRKLSDDFDRCADGLRHVRDQWDALRGH